MTYARYQPQLQSLGMDPRIFAIGASCNQSAAGLALARTSPDGNSSEILSLFVLPSYRDCGLGTALLASLEQQARARGSRLLTMTYAGSKETAAPLERILVKLNWIEPKPRMWLYMADANLLKAKWIRPHPLHPSFQLFRWCDLIERERDAMLEEQQRQPFYPASVSPFQEEEILYPESSIGLRQGDRIVGWIIAHRISPRTVRYANLFIRHEFRHSRLSLVLITEAIHRQGAHLGYDSFAVFGILSGNTRMLEFVKRQMEPFLASVQETYGTHKVLDSEAENPAVIDVEQAV